MPTEIVPRATFWRFSSVSLCRKAALRGRRFFLQNTWARRRNKSSSRNPVSEFSTRCFKSMVVCPAGALQRKRQKQKKNIEKTHVEKLQQVKHNQTTPIELLWNQPQATVVSEMLKFSRTKPRRAQGTSARLIAMSSTLTRHDKTVEQVPLPQKPWTISDNHKA